MAEKSFSLLETSETFKKGNFHREKVKITPGQIGKNLGKVTLPPRKISLLHPWIKVRTSAFYWTMSCSIPVVIIITLQLRSRRLQDFFMYINLWQVWQSHLLIFQLHDIPTKVGCMWYRRYMNMPASFCLW